MKLLFDKPRPLQEWKIGVFTAIFLPILVYLGCWQLQKATQKELLLAEYAVRQTAEPIDVTALLTMTPEQQRYRRVHVAGSFDEHKVFLLDNRSHDFRRGIEVISVFHADSGQYFLVNRGWLADSVGREMTIPTVVGKVDIVGDMYLPEKPFAAGGWSVEAAWPKRVPVLDVDKIAALGGEQFFHGVIRLAADSTTSLTPNWDVVVSVTPLKHRAYAVQWFAMAFVLAVLYIAAITRKPPTIGAKHE